MFSPSRKAVASPLLDAVTEQHNEQIRADLQGCDNATLVQDGWSNIHNEPVIATCLLVNDKSYLLDSVATGTMTKSSDDCKELCQQSNQVAEDEFGCKVTSIVTGNAKNTERMRYSLKAEDNNLVVYGCAAHLVNLLGEDLTPSATMKHVTEIQNCFRNHHKPNAWLSECADSINPQISWETRWKNKIFTHNAV